MHTYTFTSPSGRTVSVTAHTEAEARTKAMNEMHGPARAGDPVNPEGRPWTGSGLYLVSIT